MYFLLFLRGEVDAGAATVGLAATVFGTCVGTFAYAAVLDAFPIKGYDGIVAVKATGGVYHGAAAEVGERHPSLRKRWKKPKKPRRVTRAQTLQIRRGVSSSSKGPASGDRPRARQLHSV